MLSIPLISHGTYPSPICNKQPVSHLTCTLSTRKLVNAIEIKTELSLTLRTTRFYMGPFTPYTLDQHEMDTQFAFFPALEMCVNTFLM
jgi:hypothetical protein